MELDGCFLNVTGCPDSKVDIVDREFELLVTRYSEPHRFYHNVQHLEEVVNAVVCLLCGEQEVVLAAFYHDAVYDPRSKTNEIDSATFANERMLKLGIDEETTHNVVRLIEGTSDYSKTSDDPDLVRLSDADLKILGSARPRYVEYVKSVRKEYDFVSDDAWRKGRSAVLNGILARPKIYTHLVGLEDIARWNIEWELGKLNAS